MTRRLTSPRFLTACLAATIGLSATALVVPARAQEKEPAPEPVETEPVQAGPAQAAPAKDSGDAARAQALLGRLSALYVVAAERPTSDAIRAAAGDPKAVARARSEKAAKKREWVASLRAIPGLAADYVAAAGAGANPTAWYFSGYARATRTTVASKGDVEGLLDGAIGDLETYLERAPYDAVYRSDAHRTLAYTLVRVAKGDGALLGKAVPHADIAVRAYLSNGQARDAGRLAHMMLKSLIAADREADAAKLASGWDVEKADLGPSSDGVRALARRARLRPGLELAKLPALTSYTGAPMPWDSLKGKPFILHFFSTVVSTPTRDIETILVPLKKKWKDAGLLFVGCSTDREMTAAEIEQTKKNWEEWGKTDQLRDGSLASVRGWAEKRGLDWPWFWDGKWMHNALVKAVGAPVAGPYAILVGRDGKIAWRGAPFNGLKEATEALMAKKSAPDKK